jgi:serine/threonine-protein kinase HipA
MDTPVFVHVHTRDRPRLAGRLWARTRRERQSASFEYDPEWLEDAERFALEPALTLDPGPFHTPSGKPLFGAIGDSAPDRWGRALMRRAEIHRAAREQTTPRTLTEIDYLLRVNDEARLGALRFSLEEGGPFLATQQDTPIPPLMELPRLLSAATRVASDSDSDEDLRLLLAPGSSLGGARPKASVRDRDGHLAIAKFPHPGDAMDSVSWEAVALTLAAKAGVAIPDWRLEHVVDRPVLLVRRFDREEGFRIPFLSAMSMLGARDHETHSYLEFVDVLRQHGASPRADMHALWRRIVFSVLISNTDDHLRNHGFVYSGPEGWRLAPAYDVNPVPTDISPRVLRTAIGSEDTTASLDLVLSVADYFEVPQSKVTEIIAQVARAVSTWRAEAAALGLTRTGIDRMASAFEHADLRAALRRPGR